MRVCNKCKVEKPLSEYGKDKNGLDGYTYLCKECRRAANKAWRAANKDKVKEINLRSKDRRKNYYNSGKGVESSRRAHLKRKFNMTLEEYNVMSEAQDHKCYICGKSEMNNKNKVLCVDHNHETGAVRGLLCGLCNTGLGNFLDNKERLIKAIKYLEIMSTTPWEKDEKNWKNTPQFTDMNITSASEKQYNNTAGPATTSALITDEIGHLPRLYKFPTSKLVYEVKKYPDGSQYVIVGVGNELTFKLNNYSDLWTLNQINDVLLRHNRTCVLTIPNLIDAQADKRFNLYESSGLRLVCDFLNNLEAFTEIYIFHPHNPEAVEGLMPYKVNIIDNYEFIKEVLTKIPVGVEDIGKDNHLILMSSDAGGFKPLMKLADKLKWKGETYSASKSRKYEYGHSRLIQEIGRQDFEGKDILIIDDICVYGGTFKGLAKMLRERNCGKLFLAVSHMTVQNLGDDAVTNYFDKVYTTNSKFDRYWDNTDRSFSIRKNLEIIELF